MFQNMGPSPTGRSGHAMASVGTRVFVLGGESFTPTKTDDPTLVHVLDTSASLYAIVSSTPSLPLSEHIKYPSPKDPPPQPAHTSNVSLSRRSSGSSHPAPHATSAPNPTVNGRAMSPTPVPNSETEDPRRAMSPASARSTKPVNGAVFSNGKGKTPLRPKREDDDIIIDDNVDSRTSESYTRERRVSPDQGQPARAKSPGQFSVVNRAMSPNGEGQQPNLVGVTMAAVNGVNGRSSPAGDRERTKTPTDAFYNPSGSSAVNGVVRPASRTGNGSVGNVTADLLRDLKAKEVELESVKKQLAWTREGLGKASRAGYIFVDRDDISEVGEGQTTELALKFKQFKAQIQVGYLN